MRVIVDRRGHHRDHHRRHRHRCEDRGDGVYVLTNRLLKPEQIDRKSAEEELQRATEMVANTPQTRSVKERALAQARGKLRISS